MKSVIFLKIWVLLFCLLLLCGSLPAGADSIQDATSWGNKGKALAETKDYPGAVSAYDQALLLDPYYADGWKLRGDALIALERYAEASDSYERAITIDKTNAEIVGKKARAQYLQGKYRDALDTYNRAHSTRTSSRTWKGKPTCSLP